MGEIWIFVGQFGLAVATGLLCQCGARLPRRLRVLLGGLALTMTAFAVVNGALAWRDYDGDSRNWVAGDTDRRLIDIVAEVDSAKEDFGQFWR